MQQLPHEVIAMIASKANARTAARMRALDRQTASDPRMRVALKQGYLYGTGRHQKLWNELPKKILTMHSAHGERIESHFARADYAHAHDGMNDLLRKLGFAMDEYKRAVRAGEPMVIVDSRQIAHGSRKSDWAYLYETAVRVARPPDSWKRAAEPLFRGNTSQNEYYEYEYMPREAFMNGVLKRAEKLYKAWQATPFGKYTSQNAQRGRDTRKNQTRRSLSGFGRGQYYSPENRREARVDRRAERRQQRQA